MRDQRFIAIHRGGPLTKNNHQQLVLWACKCVENVLPLVSSNTYDQLVDILKVAKEWSKGITSVGNARTASFRAIAIANASSNIVDVAIARATGHVVATAHMADHSLRAIEYVLKAVKISGNSVEAERNFQNEQLPTDIEKLVLSARTK